MPEIVHVNRIIKVLFWYYWRGGKDNQMLNIHEYANVWFSRFPYFKVNFCSELQWICNVKRNRESAFNCTILSDPIVSNANSMQFSTLKSGNLENQTLRIHEYWTFDYLDLPYNNINKKLLIIRFTCTISGTVYLVHSRCFVLKIYVVVHILMIQIHIQYTTQTHIQSHIHFSLIKSSKGTKPPCSTHSCPLHPSPVLSYASGDKKTGPPNKRFETNWGLQ